MEGGQQGGLERKRVPRSRERQTDGDVRLRFKPPVSEPQLLLPLSLRLRGLTGTQGT